MSDNSATLAALALTFAPLSLLAVGGANAVIPEMHRQAVDVAGWMTDRQFAELFAIAQVAPGPNIIIVTLIGFHVAGIAGALVATTAMVGPSCLLTYFAARTWERFRAARWRVVIQAGLVPVSVGLIGASALVLARTADVSCDSGRAHGGDRRGRLLHPHPSAVDVRARGRGRLRGVGVSASSGYRPVMPALGSGLRPARVQAPAGIQQPQTAVDTGSSAFADDDNAESKVAFAPPRCFASRGEGELRQWGEQVTDRTASSPGEPHRAGLIKNHQDFWGGLALLALALFAWWATRDLPGQSGFAFGPGTAPRLFIILLALNASPSCCTACSFAGRGSNATPGAARS